MSAQDIRAASGPEVQQRGESDDPRAVAGAVHARYLDRAQDSNLRRMQVVCLALLNLLRRALLAGVLAPVRLRGRWGGGRRRLGVGVFLGLGWHPGGRQKAQSGRIGGRGEQGREDLGAPVRCFRWRGARSSVTRGCSGFLRRQTLGLPPAVRPVRDLLPGTLGRVGRLPEHLQRGGDLQVGGMPQTLHGDLRAGVVELLRLAERSVEDLSFWEVRGCRTLRGHQGDRNCSGLVDDVGELPGKVRVQSGRAQ